MSDNILVSVEAGVCRVQMHRPEKKNALTRDMYAGIAAALDRAAEDPAIRCVLLTGTGESFTAGNDIGDFQRGGGPDQPRDSARVYLHLATYAKPVVAAVNGLAIGIGTTMLLHCDIVYAASTARFRMPFVDLGLVPELGSSLLVPQLAGRHKAAELLMLGDFFDAATAQEIGLVGKVLPPEQLEAEAMATAKRLAAKPPTALKQTKALMRRDSQAILDRIEDEMALFRQQLGSAETQAILANVLKKA